MTAAKSHLSLVRGGQEYRPKYPRDHRDRCTIQGCSTKPAKIVRWLSNSSGLNVSVHVCRPHLEVLFRDHADDVGPEGYDIMNIED